VEKSPRGRPFLRGIDSRAEALKRREESGKIKVSDNDVTMVNPDKKKLLSLLRSFSAPLLFCGKK
jgi:hypothetical protein